MFTQNMKDTSSTKDKKKIAWLIRRKKIMTKEDGEEKITDVYFVLR
jgi:hypothetical protein